MKSILFSTFALAACLLAEGCGASAAEQASAGQMKILEARETTSYRAAIMSEEAQPVSIVEPGKAGNEWQDIPEARQAVADSIVASASRLAAIDYTAL